MFLLMLRCGLRVGEVSRLTWSTLNWEQGTIRIDNSKGRVDRVVYVSPDLEVALRRWFTLQPPEAHYVFTSRYPGYEGKAVSTRLIQHRMMGIFA